MADNSVKVTIFLADSSSELWLPFADDGIQAGFPSPAQSNLTETIDLNHELIKHPEATFYGKVEGESMIEEGIEPGDIIVIDRSLEPSEGDLAVCCINDEFTLKRLHLESGKVVLVPSNELFDPILVTPDDRFVVWGVVTYTIKKNRKRNRSI